MSRQIKPTLRICSQCNRPFEQFIGKYPQRICSACNPRRSPQAPSSRRVVAIHPVVKVESLPGEWSSYHDGNPRHFSSWKIDFMGKHLGGYGSGRIVVRSYDRKHIGDVVQVRIMESSMQTETGVRTHQYIVLDDAVEGACETSSKITWNILEYPFQAEGESPVEIEDFSLWARYVYSYDRNSMTYKIGLLAIVNDENPVILSAPSSSIRELIIT